MNIFFRNAISVINLIFSGLHFFWLIIVAERVNIFQPVLVLWIIPLVLLLSSVGVIFGFKRWRIIGLISYLAMSVIMIFVIFQIGYESGEFKFSRIQEIFVYFLIVCILLFFNWFDFRKRGSVKLTV